MFSYPIPHILLFLFPQPKVRPGLIDKLANILFLQTVDQGFVCNQMTFIQSMPRRHRVCHLVTCLLLLFVGPVFSNIFHLLLIVCGTN